jgi:hypothetical protein
MVTSVDMRPQSGPRMASGDLFRAYGPTVLAYALHNGARAADAEDVVRSGRAKLDSLVGDTASGRTPRRSTKNAKKTTTQPLASL